MARVTFEDRAPDEVTTVSRVRRAAPRISKFVGSGLGLFRLIAAFLVVTVMVARDIPTVMQAVVCLAAVAVAYFAGKRDGRVELSQALLGVSGGQRRDDGPPGSGAGD